MMVVAVLSLHWTDLLALDLVLSLHFVEGYLMYMLDLSASPHGPLTRLPKYPPIPSLQKPCICVCIQSRLVKSRLGYIRLVGVIRTVHLGPGPRLRLGHM